MDSKYPPWETVFYHFTQFKERGIWEEILDALVKLERNKKGKEDSPSLLAIDSQSVKKVQFTKEETGIDGGKNINGRKRTILVDTLGLPLSVKITAANVSDNQAGILAVDLLNGKVPRLQKITADMGYKNTFREHVEQNYKWEVEIGRGRQVKNQNQRKDLFHKKIGGRSKGALDGLISGVDCSEMLKKRYVRQNLCCKLHLYP